MALKQPLVITDDGEIQELQIGDSINVTPDDVERVFTSTALPGQVVYTDGAGTCDLSQADAIATARMIGMAPAGVSAAASGTVTIDGVVTLTTGEWDAVTGQTGGLTTSSKYFLDPDTAGNILPQSQIAAALSSGEFWLEVGEALSTTEFLVNRQERRVRKR